MQEWDKINKSINKWNKSTKLSYKKDWEAVQLFCRLKQKKHK